MKITYILSASIYGTIDKQVVDALFQDLKELNYEPIACGGSFEGYNESGFAIIGHANQQQLLQNLAEEYEQDAILAINPETRDAYIVDVYDTTPILDRKPDGKWCKVSHKEAIEGDYTSFPNSNLYYTIK